MYALAFSLQRLVVCACLPTPHPSHPALSVHPVQLYTQQLEDDLQELSSPQVRVKDDEFTSITAGFKRKVTAGNTSYDSTMASFEAEMAVAAVPSH